MQTGEEVQLAEMVKAMIMCLGEIEFGCCILILCLNGAL